LSLFSCVLLGRDLVGPRIHDTEESPPDFFANGEMPRTRQLAVHHDDAALPQTRPH
jgi:hypothetical protein